jgi:phage terminase small subunit
MGVPKKLTEQQIKFANLLVSEEGRMTATQCAIEAGYAKTQLDKQLVFYRIQKNIHW